MKHDIVISNLAEQDISEILDYLKTHNLSAARRWLDALFVAFDMLGDFPQMGHVREDITNKPVRFWPFKRDYLVVYCDKTPLEIVRVLSGYRDLFNLL